MKKYSSIFKMIVRNSFYKVLLISLGMVAAQIGTYFYYINQYLYHPEYDLINIVEMSWYPMIHKIAFLGIVIVLCWSGSNVGSKQGYTLMRLQIPEKQIRWMQTLHNILILFVFWGIQAMAILFMGFWYVNHAEYVTTQTLFLAFQRVDFFHSFLPMEDVLGWVNLLLLYVLVGIYTSDFSYYHRHGKRNVLVIFIAALYVLEMPRGLGEVPLAECVAILYFIVSKFIEKLLSTEEGKEA